MPKTASPGEVQVPGVGSFVANAMPDPFDGRDLEYRPGLQPLPPRLDQRTLRDRYVLFQAGSSCTGHAVATLINAVLARTVDPNDQNSTFQHVSPYMLYRLGRRYDEFEGEEDAGSSLRGVFKGWFRHGVALEGDWSSLQMDPEPDLDDDGFALRCADRPLGAFYRVNPYRLDDMQSAINELNAIAVSGVIHDGWVQPRQMTRGNETLHVILRQVNGQTLGGHAYVLVGYNEVGFLVQNSWGPGWGKDGYATLPYEDWLSSAYDAWVARPGVPKTPFASGWTATAKATSGELATAPGLDLRRLDRHVVNLGNDGFLSVMGQFTSTPDQIERIFGHMRRWHDAWASNNGATDRHVVLYAHGGLTNEASGLGTAQKHLNWWLNNRVYPLYFAWQSGPGESLIDQLVDMVRPRLPFGLGFDFVEQTDRLAEKVARTGVTWIWDQMKQNARAASRPLDGNGAIQWPPSATAAKLAMAKQPGASLVVDRLARYVNAGDGTSVKVHLVGHSAGAVFIAPLLARLAGAGIPVESLAYLAPAIRVDEFEQDVLPHLGTTVKRFVTFAMTDQRELDDVVGARDVNVYQKSLLYLVSRALERPGLGDAGEVPLVGMARFMDRALPGDSTRTLLQAITGGNGQSILSRSAAPDDGRSDSASHGGFDDDAPTMTSVVMRILGLVQASQVDEYVRDAALNPVPGLDTAPSPAAAPAPAATPTPPRPTDGAPTEPLRMAAAVGVPGQTPLVETAEPQEAQPTAPQTAPGQVVEVAAAPVSGSPIEDMLVRTGWAPAGNAPTGGDGTGNQNG